VWISRRRRRTRGDAELVEDLRGVDVVGDRNFSLVDHRAEREEAAAADANSRQNRVGRRRAARRAARDIEPERQADDHPDHHEVTRTTAG
jgi:hypothetical protein